MQASGILNQTVFAAGGPPTVTVPANPIKQSPFKANVTTCFLRLDPFMFKNLLTLSQEFLIKARTRQKCSGAIHYFVFLDMCTH